MTNSSSNLISLSWQHSIFENTSVLNTDLKDDFHFLELSLQYFFTKKIKLNIHQPYRINTRHFEDMQQRVVGISDTRIIANYFFAQNKLLSENNQLSFDGGLGVKLPTGEYKANIHDDGLPENFNVGNGSFGLLLNTTLVWTHKNKGIAWHANFLQHFKSTSNYQFGHQLSNQVLGFLEKTLSNKLKIIPAAGFRTEWIGTDNHPNSTSVHGTGGHGLYGMVSLNLKSLKYLLRCSYIQPTFQKYGGGEVRTKGRFSCQFSFLF